MSKAWAGYKNIWGAEHPTWKIVLSIDGNKPISVMFHDSIANGKKIEWSEEDWFGCLECILMDALGYMYNPVAKDFLDGFGYGEEKKAAGMSAYKECRRIYEELSKMVDDDTLESIFETIRG